MSEIIGILLAIFTSILIAGGALLLKKGASTFHANIKKIMKNKIVLWGIALYGLNIPFSIMALKFGRLSVIYPLISTSYIWITLGSKYFLKEKMTKHKIGGMILILAGVILISLF